MTDNQQSPGKLDIQWDQRAKTVTAVLDTKVLHIDRGNLTKSKFRQEFADTLVSKCPTLLRSQVVDELTRLAGEQAKPKSSDMPEAPNEDFIIARPERGILPSVSWLACPVSAIIDGKPGGRWMLYLRWSDGRREAVPLPEYVDLKDNRRLWFYPKPSEPEPTQVAGWSMASRRAWLDGGPVPDPAELFQRLCERVAYFIDLPADRAAGIVGTLTLWSMLTYCYPAWDAIPYLYIGGPLGSGKTKIFEILDRLCFRPINSSSMTGPCLFRTLNDRGGTLLLDEAERLKADTPEVKELLSMLLAGYKRGGKAARLEAVGDTFKPVQFDVYGPKAMACIAGLPPALISRCIPLTMFRAAPESVKPRRRIDEDPTGWRRLRDDLHVLALEHGAVWLELSRQSGVCPDMTGRNFELWQPILALSKWLEECGAVGLLDIMTKHAMETIEVGRVDQTPDADEVLLRTFADMIRQGQSPTPGEILKRLQDLEYQQFGKWTANTVSNRLYQYGIERPTVSHGRRTYRTANQNHLLRIQKHYGIDLEIPIPALPATPEGSKDPALAPDTGSAGSAGSARKG